MERVFGLPVAAPPRESWFSDDPLRPIRSRPPAIEVDERLAPAELENVRVIGSALAGMHYLDQRCGDGVALASAHRAARSLASPAGGGGMIRSTTRRRASSRRTRPTPA